MILAAITTCKRRPEMVERAVKSVIAQTYTDWNLVVVDDSPADYEFREDVRKMVESYAVQDERIRYVPHDRNYGAQRARNTALKIATDEDIEYIAYLDDDDEWLPEKLEKQLARFGDFGADYGIVYCRGYSLFEDAGILYERPLPALIEGDSTDAIMQYDFVGSIYPLIRTRYLNEIGGFDEEMMANQDYETWIRLSRCCYFACVNEFLFVAYRGKGKHTWSNARKPAMGLERIIAKNKAYYESHTSLYYQTLLRSSMLYRQSGEYRKFFTTWFKAVSLKPFSVISNVWGFLVAFLPLKFYTEKVRMMHVTHPKLHFYLRSLYRLLKGEKISDTD